MHDQAAVSGSKKSFSPMNKEQGILFPSSLLGHALALKSPSGAKKIVVYSSTLLAGSGYGAGVPGAARVSIGR